MKYFLRNSYVLPLVVIWFLVPLEMTAQNDGFILIVSDSDAKIMFDGDEIGTVKPKVPKKFNVDAGEHYIQAILVSDYNVEYGEVVTIEEGKQKVIKIDLANVNVPVDDIEKKEDSLLGDIISIADLDFTVPGIFAAQADEFTGYPEVRYAFEKGDKIVLNFEMKNKNGTNVIKVSTYPNQSIKYANDSFQQLKNIIINVEERSIYVFEMSTFHSFDRDCRLTIGRIPASPDTNSFNTTVSWQDQYAVVVIHQPQSFYVRSGAHSTTQGGKSRVLLPISLPTNAVMWCYEFTASRDKDVVEQNSQSFSVLADLARLIKNATVGGLLSFGIEQFTKPPGADFCDVYLLDYENSGLFLSKEPYRYVLDASREHFKSGIVTSECCFGHNLYLGIKNPDNFEGVHVAVEAAAIVKNGNWVMHAE